MSVDGSMLGGMTTYATALLRDGFQRIHDDVPSVLDGLSADELLWRPDDAANPIGWLVWHLTRQQDIQIAHLAKLRSPWLTTWQERFGLPYERNASGYGMTSAEVGAYDVTDPELLIGYQDATYELTAAWLDEIDALDGGADAEWARVIDRAYTPPVTVAVRALSVFDDAAKHLGQAEYVKGLVQRRR